MKIQDSSEITRDSWRNFSGYVKMTVKEDPVGREWCIPHKEVYNPKKKLVLDYFAEFKEISLNKNLMRYPDLTNQIVSIIVSFRQQSVVSVLIQQACGL